MQFDLVRVVDAPGAISASVTGAGIRRISSFGDPQLVTVFGFGPDLAQAPDMAQAQDA